jgi:hypothetical protein
MSYRGKRDFTVFPRSFALTWRKDNDLNHGGHGGHGGRPSEMLENRIHLNISASVIERSVLPLISDSSNWFSSVFSVPSVVMPYFSPRSRRSLTRETATIAPAMTRNAQLPQKINGVLPEKPCTVP